MPRMSYSVLLVQRGITSQTHPVSGKSGKLYGNAIASPKDGGVVFKMTQADYEAASEDILGNTAAGQQWVPKIDMQPAFVVQQQQQQAPRPKCDRCSKPSVARWDRYDYCAEHAPNNAVWFDENEHIAWLAGPRVAESGPSVEPEGGAGVTEPGDLPRETLPPPFAGSAAEEAAMASGVSGPGPIVESDLPPNMRRDYKKGSLPIPPAGFVAGATGPIQETGPSGATGAPQAPPAVASEKVEPVAHPQHTEQVSEKTAAVVSMITDAVIQAVMPRLEGIIDSRIQNSQPSKNNHRRPVEKKTEKKKPVKAPPKAPPAAPRKTQTEFQSLQTRARELKINVFGKGAEALKAAIAEAEEGAK
jgi:hypothetical protein